MGATGAVPVCEEKSRLVRAYSFSAEDYNRAVMVLRERIAVLSKRDYDEIRAFAEDTRRLVEYARAALDQHTAEHGC